jgi:oligopeptide/dipeptide ABC transporter ATP-binding protein
VSVSKIDPDGKQIRNIRGNRISMIFQDPMSSLNPVYTIGDQIIENIRIHTKVDKSTAKKKAIELLNSVKISSPHLKANNFPHQFSGGMRQRVLIAMALSCNPNLLIADEPTTALDVTVQEQILELFNELKAQYKTAALFISHDLGVIAKIADFVAVMYLGKIVEYGPVDDIFSNPAHPYTKGLIKSTPSILGSRKLKLDTIEGQVPTSNIEIKGCVFYSRCEYATKECQQTSPEMVKMKEDHVAACLKLN